KPVHLGRLHGLQAPDSYLNTYIPVLFLYETVNPFHFLPLIGEAGDQGPYFFSGRLRDFITSFEQMLIYPPAVFLPIVEPAIHPLIPEIHRRNQHMRKKGTRRGRKRLFPAGRKVFYMPPVYAAPVRSDFPPGGREVHLFGPNGKTRPTDDFVNGFLHGYQGRMRRKPIGEIMGIVPSYFILIVNRIRVSIRRGGEELYPGILEN